MPYAPEQYLRPEVIQQIQQLDLRAKFIVEGFIAGLHRSPFHGFSVEFSEHRKYTPGDDLRAIDWNVFAKTDRYYIKKFQAETNLEAYLLVDCSGSMDFATDERMTKMEYAICLAASLGYMMVHQQDPVGLFLFDNKVRRFLPPKAKRSHLTNVLAELARTKPSGETRLSDCLHRIAERIRKRSLVVLLSDLLEEPDDVIRAMHHLRHGGHDLIVFGVFDHSEVAFEFGGQMEFVDPETRERHRSDPQAVRAGYLAEIEAFIETYRRACLRMEADFVVVDNAMTFDRALLEFLVQRQAKA